MRACVCFGRRGGAYRFSSASRSRRARSRASSAASRSCHGIRRRTQRRRPAGDAGARTAAHPSHEPPGAARRACGSESPADVRASCSLAHSFRGPSMDACVRSCLLARVFSARMHAFGSHSPASWHARRARYGRAGLRGSVACLDGRFAACEVVGACGQLVGLLCHLRRAIAIRYSVPRVAFDRAHLSPHLHPH